MNKVDTQIIILCLVIIFCTLMFFLVEKTSTKVVRTTTYNVTCPIINKVATEAQNEMIFCNTISLFNEDKVIISAELYHSDVDSVFVEVEEITYRYKGTYVPE